MGSSPIIRILDNLAQYYPEQSVCGEWWPINSQENFFKKL